MIYYTIQGFRHQLEFHDDKILLNSKSIWSFPFTKKKSLLWNYENLISFNITKPKIFLFGKLEWQDSEGKKGTLYFTCSHLMMKKIEKYMKKKIAKNLESIRLIDDEFSSLSRSSMDQTSLKQISKAA